MKKLDRRIVRSRRALTNTLITLALERGYENLTIREVTYYEGVGYRTFHRHYQSLDNLLTQILTTAFQEYKERALQVETPHGEVLAFYIFIKDHADVMRVYVNLSWKHPARQTILKDVAQVMYARYAQKSTTSVPLDVAIDHMLLAKNHLVASYLDHINDYTPQQAADIHDQLVIKALERLALELRDDWMQKRHHTR